MTDMTLHLNPAAHLEIRRVGREQQPLVIVDNVFTNPDILVAAARTAKFEMARHTRYPGLNAPLPAGFMQSLMPALQQMMTKVFGIPPTLRMTHFGFLGLPTLPPEALEPIQKIPHQDTPEHNRLASVYYMSVPTGGTGFFRHRATGYEVVTPDRRAHYVATVSAELEAGGAALTRHVSAETPYFELIDWVPAAFNRLILYRSNALHSALIDGVPLSDDPATGRLTANLFLLPVQKLY
ncbi:histidyl-tRNA synthetase, class IIA [Asticcacaulis biprosthecium C19]|uniref:Histidyl-tRNA synthetase, class IIA n=1 Tax=Asticcacaulis biprosthecium C19 TaxID=715226 RepID=F4QK14_9CAUL|nr:DUF6445 family protein [Asticcacaulis biprosthecium]EGF92041.1 histidyl-tRNA synthetase, class IIA [Asticcacaulis biprosthecium C19]